MWLSTWWYNVAQQDKNHSPCTTDLIVSWGGRLLSVEPFHENQEGNEGKCFRFLRLRVINQLQCLISELEMHFKE